MNLDPQVVKDFTLHAEKDFPSESCGVVQVFKGKQKYIPMTNLAEDPGEHFVFDPKENADIEDEGGIVAIVHSHPNEAPIPSDGDLVSIEKSGLPWVIVNWPTGKYQIHKPTGYELPLIGRNFHYGVVDCFTLCQDYYDRYLKIEVKDIPRDKGWWDRGENIYKDFYEKLGFVEVDKETFQLHDWLILKILSPVPNHSAIYSGGGRMMHHMTERLSCEEIYDGFYRKSTVVVLRHKSLT